jgi:hypothetical protein
MRGMNQEAGEPPGEVYRRYLESGVLGFQRRAGCGAAVYYPRVLCPVCGAMLYDAFTINTELFLEDLGFCEKGAGGAFVSGVGSHRVESLP